MASLAAALNVGKCPHCGQVIRSVKVEYIEVTEGPGKRTFHGASFLCSNLQCHKILSVELDPLAAQKSLLERIKKLLGK